MIEEASRTKAAFNRRSATGTRIGTSIRGLKPTATVNPSLRDRTRAEAASSRFAKSLEKWS
jgi:hypothetical protein